MRVNGLACIAARPAGLVRGVAPRERAPVRLGHAPMVRDDRRADRLLRGRERHARRARPRPRPRSPGRLRDGVYTDAVVQTYSHAKPKAGWNAHVYGLCDVATLQQQYDVPSSTTAYSVCLDVPTELSIDASKTSVTAGAMVTFTATLGSERHRAALEQPRERADRRAPAAARVGLERPRHDGRRLRRRLVHGEPQRLGDPRLPRRLPQAVQRGPAWIVERRGDRDRDGRAAPAPAPSPSEERPRDEPVAAAPPLLRRWPAGITLVLVALAATGCLGSIGQSPGPPDPPATASDGASVATRPATDALRATADGLGRRTDGDRDGDGAVRTSRTPSSPARRAGPWRASSARSRGTASCPTRPGSSRRRASPWTRHGDFGSGFGAGRRSRAGPRDGPGSGTARRARPGSPGSGAGTPVAIDAPPGPGGWSLQVDVRFDGGGRAAWYWRVRVDR